MLCDKAVEEEMADIMRDIRITNPATVSVGVRDKILRSHKLRCDSQGHDWSDCLDAAFHYYRRCRWCRECDR